MNIKNHPNFDADDYAYLRAKGWTNSEITERWTAERKQGNGPCKWEGQSRAKLMAVIKH